MFLSSLDTIPTSLPRKKEKKYLVSIKYENPIEFEIIYSPRCESKILFVKIS